MPPAATKPPTQRKRNRKRKRRAASSSSSSSSSTSEDEAPQTTTQKIVPVPLPESNSSSSDSDSSGTSSSDEEDTIPRGRQPPNVAPKTPRQFSSSPSPPSAALPSFLPSENAGDDAGSKEKELKDRFRQFWMTSVADGFKDDLEEIRKVSRYFRVYIEKCTDISQFVFLGT